MESFVERVGQMADADLKRVRWALGINGVPSNRTRRRRARGEPHSRPADSTRFSSASLPSASSTNRSRSTRTGVRHVKIPDPDGNATALAEPPEVANAAPAQDAE